MSAKENDDEVVDYKELNINLSSIKSRIVFCLVNNPIADSTSKKLTAVYYANHDNAKDLQQVRAFRNLYGKKFCGVTCLYALALHLLSQNKSKIKFPSDVTTFEEKIDYCIDEVNKTMIEQAGK